MKNSRILGIIAIIAIIGFMVTACEEPSPYPLGTPDSNFYGRWRDNATAWRQNTISANKLVFLDSQGRNYTMEDLTWTMVNNDGENSSIYPSGVTISGTITATTGNVIANATTGALLKKGDVHTRTFL